MTDNKNNPKIITNEQPSIAADDINTKKGNANVGNTAGDNADFSSRRKSFMSDHSGATVSGGSFGGSGQYNLGGHGRNFQTNNYADESKKCELAKIKREGLVNVAIVELGEDMESIKTLFEILPSVEEIVKKEKK